MTAPPSTLPSAVPPEVTPELPSVAVLGGTGALGNGLARRWAAAGLRVIIGSRSEERARSAAADIPAGPGTERVVGLHLVPAAQSAEVVVLAVPWQAHAETCAQVAPHVAGKVVVDVVNPLGFDKQGAFALPVAEGSAAQQAQALLPDATVTAAFHHVSAPLLADGSLDRLDGDVMVLGDQRAGTDLVQRLVEAVPGLRGVYAGRLRNAAQVEALTANLISVNRRYKTHSGIALTNVST